MKLLKTFSLIAVSFIMCFAVSKAQMGGTVTVGTGGDYTSLATLFSDLQTYGLYDDLVIEIVSDIDLGTTGAELRMWNYGISYSVTMRPTGGDRRIYGSISGTNGLIELSSVHNFEIDGRIDGVGSGRHLTLENTSTGTYAALVWLKSGGTGLGCSDITIRNCNIIGGSRTSSYTIGIAATSATSFTSYGYDNDNITIHDNQFKRLYYATRLYGGGSALTSRIEGITFTDNTIGSAVSSDGIYNYGIYIYYAADVVITGNEIFNFDYSSSYAAYLYYIDELVFNNNILHDCYYYGAYSYYLSGDCTINNNQLYQTELSSYNFYYGLYLKF